MNCRVVDRRQEARREKLTVFGLTVTTVNLTVLKDAQQNRQSTLPRVSLQMLPETTVCGTASKVGDPS